MTGLCRSCKWWRTDDDGEYIFGVAGGEQHKPCEHPKVGGGSYGDSARRGHDALNSYETISTGPDFGCIHWEEKAHA